MHDVHVAIKVHLEIQGRINYNDLLMILSKEGEIYRIETEKGLEITYGDYVLTIRFKQHTVDPSVTAIEIIAETTRMDLVKLAEKVDNLAGKILRLVSERFQD